MTDRTRLPLPEGDRFADVLKFRSLGQGGGRKFYECWVDAIHAYSDAENAALRERVKVLEEAIQHYESALRDAWPEGAKGASWEFWNRARIVLSALEKT